MVLVQLFTTRNRRQGSLSTRNLFLIVLEAGNSEIKNKAKIPFVIVSSSWLLLDYFLKGSGMHKFNL